MVAIGPSSGLAGIAYWINANYRLNDDEKLDKKDPLVEKMKEWVDGEYANGRQTTLSNHEVEVKLNELSNGRFSMID